MLYNAASVYASIKSHFNKDMSVKGSLKRGVMPCTCPGVELLMITVMELLC